jgi:hypothetical protein
VLLFDGMGGPSGMLPHHLMRYTADQVEAWWLRPMAAVRKAAERAQQGGRPTSPAPPAAPLGAMSLEEYKATFGPFVGDKPADWWQASHRKWQEEAARG